MADDNQALLLQVSADLSKLTKAFQRANGIVDQEGNKIERRAKKMADKIEASVNPNIGKALEKVFDSSRLKILDSGAARISVFGSALEELGPVGIGAAAGIAAVGVAVAQAKGAMQWADDLQAIADHIGVTAEQLQALQFAAGESDVEIGAMQESLANLNGSLGAIQSGVGAAKIEKAFAAINITPEQLKGMDNASDLLPLLADRIGALGTRAEQVQIARKLGIEALLPMLHGGAAGLKSMTDRASELGLVIDNKTTSALADMNREVEISSQRIDTQLKKTFLGLAPAITSATGVAADFLTMINKINRAIEVSHGAPRTKEEVGADLLKGMAEQRRLISAYQDATSDKSRAGIRTQILGNTKRLAMLGAEISQFPADEVVKPTAPVPPTPLTKTGTGRARGGAALKPKDPRYETTKYTDTTWAMTQGEVSQPNYGSLGKGDTTEIDTTLQKLPKVENAMARLQEAGSTMGDVFEDAFQRAADGSDTFAHAAIQDLQQIAAQWAASQLASLLFGQRGSDGERSGGVFNSLFSGHRAAGGPVQAGKMYMVGEKGPEPFIPASNGTILPNSALRAPTFALPQMTQAHTVIAPLIQIGPDASGMLSDRWVTGLNDKLRAVHASAVNTALSQARRNLPGWQNQVSKRGA